MLKSLKIKNIALIDELNIEFSKGLNILSGETGAGKSIIFDSLCLAMGDKADLNLIRFGQSYAEVEATFVSDEYCSLRDILKSFKYELADSIVLNRKISIDGTSELSINKKPVSLISLKRLTSKLIDIHGQNEHMSLLKVASHIQILDDYDKANIYDIKEEVKELFNQYKDVIKKLSVFGMSESERARNIDMLSYQIDEIEKANIKVNELEELQDTRKKIINTEKILSNLKDTIGNLENNEFNVYSMLSSANKSLSSISNLDNSLIELNNRLENVKIEIEDILEELKNVSSSYNFDDKTADYIENRIDLIKNLYRKYGGSYEEVQSFLIKAKEDLSYLNGSNELIEQLTQNKNELEQELIDKCSILTSLRKDAASRFTNEIVTELNDLGMKSASFEVRIEPLSSIENFERFVSANGFDSVEFYLSANKGEPLKPLLKVISGGEMSRFMLALKNITAKIENIPTMVFDEIDTGISGNIANVVAKKLSSISRSKYQILAITHLPQIVSIGDRNFLIKKEEINSNTYTRIEILDEENKIKEIARLIGGSDNLEYAKLHANELIKTANEYKNNYKGN